MVTVTLKDQAGNIIGKHECHSSSEVAIVVRDIVAANWHGLSQEGWKVTIGKK